MKLKWNEQYHILDTTYTARAMREHFAALMSVEHVSVY